MTEGASLDHRVGWCDGAAPSRDAETLNAVHHSVLRLASAVSGVPKRIRVKVGDVVVELEWTGGPSSGEAASSAPTSAGGPIAEPDTSPEKSALRYLCAPTVGTFYRAPKPDGEPFVREHDVVHPGQQVGIIEVMKLMLPVEAEIHGRVVEILARDGMSVDYGQRLFSVAAASPEHPAG
jgi:acetyl-CoA carboxylase biotin carboxyl carrier protein